MRPQDLSFDAAIGFAADLIRIPSPTGGEEEVARRVVEEYRRLGFDEAWIDDVGNAVGVVRGQAGQAGAPAVMLSSHLDVVDAGDPDEWEYPPHGGVLADGFLHGRGAMDIKGPLAIQTYAAALCAAAAERPAGDIIVAHTVFEERGGWGMDHLMRSGAVSPGAVIIGESTAGDICIGHRGRAELLVEVQGRAGHASAPGRAVNALDGLGPVLDALRDFPSQRLTAEDPVLGRSTLVATDVVASPGSRNVIPDLATVAVDWRVLPDLDADGAAALLQGYLEERVALPEGLSLRVRYSTAAQRSWTGRERSHRMFTPGFLLEPEHAIVGAAAEAVRAGTGRDPGVRPWRFATDGGHTCGEHGVPTIGFAPGEERYAHTNTERLALEPARLVYEAYPGLIRAVLGALHTGGGAG